jgi:predicted alpha/beta hydrolase
MDTETYYIPANFTDAGRLLGLFEIRNVIEAIVIGLPVLFLAFALLPFKLTTRLIAALVLFVPSAGFALIGIGDDSLTRYVKAWRKWRRHKRILTYKGETNYAEFERAYLRR